ncbi:hypothetical protein KAR34_04020 [bacterium]|nr:hypothetical protein [bacterium]
MPAPTVKLVTLNNMPRMPVWTRLGYREKTMDKAALGPKYETMLEQFVNETQVRIFYVEKSFAIENNENVIAKYHFTSTLIRERFAGVRKVMLLGASVVKEDYQKLLRLLQTDMQQAVVLDAVLAEKVDFALDFIERELAVSMRRVGRRLGRRLSCGYSDFALEHQRYFFTTLGFAEYDITINERFILSPEKTVTALAPIHEQEQTHE